MRPRVNAEPASASVRRSADLGGGAGAPANSGSFASGKRSRNSRVVVSGSRPKAFAYARMKDRRKIPDGHRVTSSGAGSWKSERLIVVLSAFDLRSDLRDSRFG